MNRLRRSLKTFRYMLFSLFLVPWRNVWAKSRIDDLSLSVSALPLPPPLTWPLVTRSRSDRAIARWDGWSWNNWRVGGRAWLETMIDMRKRTVFLDRLIMRRDDEDEEMLQRMLLMVKWEVKVGRDVYTLPLFESERRRKWKGWRSKGCVHTRFVNMTISDESEEIDGEEEENLDSLKWRVSRRCNIGQKMVSIPSLSVNGIKILLAALIRKEWIFFSFSLSFLPSYIVIWEEIPFSSSDPFLACSSSMCVCCNWSRSSLLESALHHHRISFSIPFLTFPAFFTYLLIPIPSTLASHIFNPVFISLNIMTSYSTTRRHLFDFWPRL